MTVNYRHPNSSFSCYINQCLYQGRDSTIGCACYIDDICESDAVLINVLKKHGAVPFVRTNVPQALFRFISQHLIIFFLCDALFKLLFFFNARVCVCVKVHICANTLKRV